MSTFNAEEMLYKLYDAIHSDLEERGEVGYKDAILQKYLGFKESEEMAFYHWYQKYHKESEAKKAKIKEQALSKLTPEEKKALGV